MLFSSKEQDWFRNVRGDVLAGTVVALALIPEAFIAANRGDTPPLQSLKYAGRVR
jgi:MFS superfamily sulfate permease-like transporter